MFLQSLALSTAGLITANVLVSVVAMVLGTFMVTSPDTAAKIWGSHRFDKLAPERRASFVHWYRVFGILLLLVGALSAIDSVLSAQ